jgi:hypothetical protein
LAHSGKNHRQSYDALDASRWLLNDKEETEAMAALNHLDVGRLNKILAIFTSFAKSAEGNSVSYFDTFPMLQSLIANLGSVRPNKYAETLMKAMS